MAPLTARGVGERLVAFAAERLDRLLTGPFAGWRLPRVWGGHRVGADVAADLAFTIHQLRAGGVTEVGAAPIDGALQIVLRQVDGPGTHTFFSYRVAETLLPHGRFDENHLLAGWTEAERQNLRAACDSTTWIDLLDEGVPRNYHAVLARCELGRANLGLVDGDGPHLAELVAGTAAMLGDNPLGFLDDSLTRIGRYDIYTADVHLFCEPLADRLGPAWDRGMRAALDLVRRTAAPDGSAIGWGRSTGALAVCLTAELAALALEREMTDEQEVWAGLAATALTGLDDWFDDHGVVTAHVDRSTYYYRGPERRLQMTVDCLGKVAEAGRRLAALASDVVADPDAPFSPRDDWTPFDDRNAGAWTVRTPKLAFTLPVTGSTVNDYLPAPHQPRRLEVAVQDPLPGATPVVFAGDSTHVGGGLPDEIEHADHTLTWQRDGFPSVGQFEGDGSDELAGSRRVTWSVEGRTLRAEERWSFADVPDAIVWQWADTESASTSLRVTSDATHHTQTVDVGGLKEWRSFWGPLTRLHQVEFDPAAEIAATIELTTRLRVGSTAFGHHYDRSLYRPIRHDVDERPSPWQPVGPEDPDAVGSLDVFHLHWPEWLAFDDVGKHERIIGALRRHDVGIVWTQHNLEPHTKPGGRFDDVYAMWAREADAVIHHTEWGRREALDRLRFRDDALQRVIPHGYWRREAEQVASVSRTTVEAELGLRPCAIRLGIIGAPRHEKRVQAFMDGFARCQRDDLGLVVWSLGADDRVPGDERIEAHPYEGVDRERYDRRLRAVDVLVLPFAPGMLATGTAGDAIAHGLAVMASDWGFLTETFGDAALACPLEPEAIAAVLDDLSPEAVARSAAAVADLRATHEWTDIATETLRLLDELPRPPRRV